MTKIYVERDSDVNFLNHVNFLAVTNYEARAHYFFTFIGNLRAIRNDLIVRKFSTDGFFIQFYPGNFIRVGSL